MNLLKGGESTLGFMKEVDHQVRVLENPFAHILLD